MPTAPRDSWRFELFTSLTSPDELPLSTAKRRQLARVIARYPMRVPPHLAAIIDWENPRCPIRRQLIPDPRELAGGGSPDPMDEERHQVVPGVIRRFGDRLLALVTASCPVLCRHCNRKRTWTRPLEAAGPEALSGALGRSNRVREVILSGGEPLLLSDGSLDRLLQAARSRQGVELVRLHSRAPVSLPSRLTPGLVRMFARHRPLWFVTHFNHALEITPAAKKALARLTAAGIPVLNQAVLLRGVNDSLVAQLALGRALVACGVKPYYLFQLDRASGTLHFQVPLAKALGIVDRLQRRYSGLLVPRLAVDLPGRGGKVALGPSALVRRTKRGVWLRGADGRQVLYEDGTD